MIHNVQKQCILCGTAEALNTAMAISLDDEPRTKVTVALCDTCSEDATPRRAREAYLKKQVQIDEVIAQARALGLELSPSNTSGLVVAQAPPAPPRAPAAIRQAPEVAPLLEGEDVIPTSVIDLGSMVSVGGVTQLGGSQIRVQSHASHDLNSLQDRLPDDMRDGRARMQVVQGRCGQPISIPALRSDRTGVTKIRVVKSDDQQLQQRARRLCEESSPTQAWLRPSFRDGYRIENQERRCPLCGGGGHVQQASGSQLCPKCSGTGIV